MSVHALSCVLGNGSETGRSDSEGYQRLVLLAVAHRADDHGFAWPKIADLAKQANVHRSTVNRNLDELIALDELRMFTRGHYRSPVYVMTIVDHPLSTQEIVDRLIDLDPRAQWRERVIHRTTGEASEEPVPVQPRLSQSATISQNHTTVSQTSRRQAADQELHLDHGRENDTNPAGPEIVAERDDLPEIVAERDEIVAVARRSSEPSKNRHRTRARRLDDSIENELLQLAYRKAKAKGAYNVEGLASKILSEDRDLLTAELGEEMLRIARTKAILDCPRCDDNGFAWSDEAGCLVDRADMAADRARVCDHQREGDPPAADVSPVPDGEGSPTGGASHCVECGVEAPLVIGGLPACLDCFNSSLTEAVR